VATDRDAAATPNWVAKIERALDEHDLNRTQFCELLAVEHPDVRLSPRTLQNTLRLRRTPAGADIRAIADVLGLDVKGLFDDLGWLDARERPTSLSAHTAAAVTVRLLLAGGRLGGPDLLVQRAINLKDWDVHVRTPLRGTIEHVRQNHYVGLRHVSEDFATTNGLATPKLIDRITRDFGLDLQMAPALPELSESVCADLTRDCWPDAQAWYLVPCLTALRLPESPMQLDAYDTIVVAGNHGAGADDVGAHLADRFKWGYANTSFVAQQAYGRLLASFGQDAHDRRCSELGAAFLSAGQGQHMVIAHGNPRTASEVCHMVVDQAIGPRTAHDVNDEDPSRGVLLIWVEAGPTLRMFGQRMWGTRPDGATATAYATVARQGEVLQKRIKRLRERGPDLMVETVDLDPGVLTTDPTQQQDAIDALSDASWGAFERLAAVLEPRVTQTKTGFHDRP